MKKHRPIRRRFTRVAAVAALLMAVATAPTPLPAQTTAGATTIFLVRHAERANDDPRDPGLTPAGVTRAEELARVLGDAGITAIYSTPFRRTMATARPIAEKAGLQIQNYDPLDPAAMRAFVETLRTARGRILVSGHSNTTPGLVEALGGDPVSELPETEYDRLYILTIGRDGSVMSVLLRYGAPSVN